MGTTVAHRTASSNLCAPSWGLAKRAALRILGTRSDYSLLSAFPPRAIAHNLIRSILFVPVRGNSNTIFALAALWAPVVEAVLSFLATKINATEFAANSSNEEFLNSVSKYVSAMCCMQRRNRWLSPNSRQQFRMHKLSQIDTPSWTCIGTRCSCAARSDAATPRGAFRWRRMERLRCPDCRGRRSPPLPSAAAPLLRRPGAAAVRARGEQRARTECAARERLRSSPRRQAEICAAQIPRRSLTARTRSRETAISVCLGSLRRSIMRPANQECSSCTYTTFTSVAR
jgi:hypothetical protein